MSPTTTAEAAIRERMAREGRITFRDFMEMALYSAPGCYYGSTAEKIGAGGDYFTSPEVHPAFGALVARQVEQVWVALGRPERFALVEMGAGTGALARDILSYTSRWTPSFHQALDYAILELSPALLRRQQQTLSELGSAAERVSWTVGSASKCGLGGEGEAPAEPPGARGPGGSAGASPSQRKPTQRRPRCSTGGERLKSSLPGAIEGEAGAVEGCFLSNELLDSFPVHRVAVVGGDLKEIYVELQDGNLVESLDSPSDPRLEAYFDALGLMPPEGCRAEVNLAALDWISGVARALRRGAVLTLDYGHPAEELYSRRHREGTLLCFYRHTLNSDPFARVGEQDMTTHVDFTSLSAEGLAHGLEPLGLSTQRSFLSALGMDGYLAALPLMGLRLHDYEANRMALRELLKADGLGRIKVLLQQKGLQGLEPAGFRAEGLRPEDLQRDFRNEPVPLLTRSHMPLTTPPSTEPLTDEEGMWKELFGEGGENREGEAPAEPPDAPQCVRRDFHERRHE